MGLRKILFCVTVSSLVLVWGPVASRDQSFRVVYDQGRLSVSAENARLEDVLAAIAEKTGISVKSPESLDKSITIQLDGMSLEEGLNFILRDVNHVLFFSPTDENTDRAVVSGVYIPAEDIKGSRARPPGASSAARRMEPGEQEDEEDLEDEEIAGGMMEMSEEEDPVLLRYEEELDRLEQQMEMVEEDSPQAQAIMSKIERLQRQIEKRLDELEGQETE